MKPSSSLRRLLLPLALCGASAGAHADCFVSTQPVAFGTYQAAQVAAVDTAFDVTYSCTKRNEQFSVAFGAGVSGNVNARAMANGASRMQYQLYLNSARTQPIVASILRVKADNTLNLPDVVTYYARLFGNQDVAPGAYTDTITITVTP